MKCPFQSISVSYHVEIHIIPLSMKCIITFWELLHYMLYIYQLDSIVNFLKRMFFFFFFERTHFPSYIIYTLIFCSITIFHTFRNQTVNNTFIFLFFIVWYPINREYELLKRIAQYDLIINVCVVQFFFFFCSCKKVKTIKVFCWKIMASRPCSP